MYFPDGTVIGGAANSHIGEFLLRRIKEFDAYIREQERINNAPNPEEERRKIAEEKRQAREARLAEIRKRQDEERKKQQEEYNTLKALYPRGVRYAVNYKGWNISDCLNHQADIKEYERVEREKERKQEQEEAERRRKQQEKESALQYINNAVANWGRARGEVPVYSLFYYYPTTCTDVLIDPKKQLVRKMIWNFKDGIYSPISRYVEKVFEHFFGRERLKYITFVCIPASSTLSNEKRYKFFSTSICEKMGMENAFPYITLKENRTASHLGGDNSSDNIRIDGNFFYGKYVILFDDITTRGDSMANMKRKLETAGAKVLCGITLGRTVHTDRGANPIELIN